MSHTQSGKELHHEIFGSILDRTEMTPFLLLPARDYVTALSQAARMMANRGFDILGNNGLLLGETKRANRYVEGVYNYFLNWLFPFVRKQLEGLAALHSANLGLYRDCLQAIGEFEALFMSADFRAIVGEAPRHLFLLASSRRYPHVFHEQSWRASELKGDSHHDAYKFRQLVSVMNKVFSHRFRIPKENLAQLRTDQGALFP